MPFRPVYRIGMPFLGCLVSHENWSYAQLRTSNGALCLPAMGQRNHLSGVTAIELLGGISRRMAHAYSTVSNLRG